MQAIMLERQAMLAGSDADQAHRFVEGLRDQARKLRLPETIANERPQAVRESGYEHDFKSFLQPYKYRRDGSTVEDA